MKYTQKPRQNFIRLFNYMLSELDVEKLIDEHGTTGLNVYQSAMRHFEDSYGNGLYVNLEFDDLMFLDSIKHTAKNHIEIASQTEFSQSKIAALSTKLIQKGLIVTRRSKVGKENYTFYEITLYGKQRLVEEVERREKKKEEK